MFETFRLSRNNEETVRNIPNDRIIANKLEEIIPKVPQNYFFWNSRQPGVKIMHIISTLARIDQKPNEDPGMSLKYFYDDVFTFRTYTASKDSSYGLYINEGPSTHFDIVEYPEAEYLEGAQEVLKITASHFLKIFTTSNNNILYVYTNKTLPIEAVYKLLDLAFNLHAPKASIVTDFIKALIAEDEEAARKILVDFENSDFILKIQHDNFISILNSTGDKKIRNLERQITNYRNDIASYENHIAVAAREMRELNKQILFYKSIDDSEEKELLYKHLCKHPYIKDFTANANDSSLDLMFYSPILYFNEVPAEKYLEKDHISEEQKRIIRIILGKKYQLWTQCRIGFYTDNFTVEARNIEKSNEYLPHPHITSFHCFGNHRQSIKESAEAGDYIGAIEQISQAVMNLNFYDSCVVEDMCKKLNRKQDTLKTWLCKETGELLTTAEVLERNDYYEETQSE